MTRFVRYQLRTTDVPAARAFYTKLLGEEPDLTPLPAQALARGARSHWLGHLGVTDVERTAQAFVERGATRLGPQGDAAVLRDPGGAIVALAKGSEPSSSHVSWHALNTLDVTLASETYRALFGWELRAPIDLAEHGLLHPFAFEAGGPLQGSIVDAARRPGIHPHWLFHFSVPSLEAALAHVRDAGGLVIGPFTLPDGGRVAVCDDPQGTAFALRG